MSYYITTYGKGLYYSKIIFKLFLFSINMSIVSLTLRNGSVQVDFKVVYRKNPDPVVNEKTVVAQTLKEEIFKNKKLGKFDLDITKTFIQGKSVFRSDVA